MRQQTKAIQFRLPVRSQMFRNEGPQGFLLRLAESNLLSPRELKLGGISLDFETLHQHGLIPEKSLDPGLYDHIQEMCRLWTNEPRVWNMQHARFCPHCLKVDGHWRVEWELNFYDVCHQHGVWLIDQCTSCGEKLSWHRTEVMRCQCGSILTAEFTNGAPESMVKMANVMSSKIRHQQAPETLVALKDTNIEQTQRLIRYLGNYMSQASGKNPLKMRNAGDLKQSWPVTSLAAEVLNDWPRAFHDSLNKIEKSQRSDGRPSFNQVFGHAYHYVFKALKEAPFNELRRQFELWINGAWRGGIAKRNKRLTSTLMENASWIPAIVACDYLGISHQRLDMLIREGIVEGETHISEKGRKFVMVRRDNLSDVKQQLFGLIDMTTAGRLLGLQKRRMRQVLNLIFVNVKKMGPSNNAPWSISRIEINQLLELSVHLEMVAIPDEDCISFGHILRYWTWTNRDIAAFIASVKSEEIKPVNLLDSAAGIAAWNFRDTELKNWKIKTQNGLGEWLTIAQAAKVLGTKEQVAYELVRLGLLKAEVMPYQMKRGTRVRRTEIENFNEHYIFATKLAEEYGCSPRKLINNLSDLGVLPISGPMVDGARQVVYKYEQAREALDKLSGPLQSERSQIKGALLLPQT